MFDIGTKIAIVQSNVTNPTGVKKGSTGYVVIGNRGLERVTENPLTTNIRSMTILFSRYGYENKIREESRTINVILPVTYNNEFLKLKTFIKRIQNKDTVQAIMDQAGIAGSPNPLCIVGPIQKPSDMLHNDHDFCCWVKSYLLAEENFSIIENFSSKKKAQNVCKQLDIDYSFVRLLHEMAYDKSARRHNMPKLMSNREQTIRTIRFIHQMNSVNERQTYLDWLKETRRFFDSENKLNKHEVYAKIMPVLFQQGKADVILKQIATRCTTEQDKKLIEYLFTVQKDLVSLARYAVEGVGDGVGK